MATRACTTQSHLKEKQLVQTLLLCHRGALERIKYLHAKYPEPGTEKEIKDLEGAIPDFYKAWDNKEDRKQIFLDRYSQLIQTPSTIIHTSGSNSMRSHRRNAGSDMDDSDLQITPNKRT